MSKGKQTLYNLQLNRLAASERGAVGVQRTIELGDASAVRMVGFLRKGAAWQT